MTWNAIKKAIGIIILTLARLIKYPSLIKIPLLSHRGLDYWTKSGFNSIFTNTIYSYWSFLF